MTVIAALLTYLVTALAPAPAARPAAIPVYGYEIARSYPHDPDAFTQGLFFRDGALYESTGLEGRSTIRKVRLQDGKVLQTASLPGRQFGEGSTDWNGEIISVTWQDQVGYRWDRATLKVKSTFRYTGEGWGLANDGRNLILSDGTSTLRFLDPISFKERRRIGVTAAGRPVTQLNELEWVKGEILANIWQTDLIARIDPATGNVKGVINLAGLARAAGGGGPDNVLNGIAYDRGGDRLFVTGKRWSKLFEIRLKPAAR